MHTQARVAAFDFATGLNDVTEIK